MWTVKNAKNPKITTLNRQCNEIFCNLFSWTNPFGSLINSIRWFCWKILFAKIFIKNVTPLSVWYCAESDPAQYHTAPRREIEMLENPKLSKTARSQTLRSLILSDSAQCDTARSLTPCSISLRIVKLFFFLSKTYISMTFKICVMIFRKKFENISKIQKWLTLRRVQLRTVWYCTESDSAQCETAVSRTLRSITLRGVNS